MLDDAKIWILSADRAKAKIYEWLPQNNFLEELTSFEEADARKHEHELKADRPGHGNNPTSRYAVEDKASYKLQASQKFLKGIAEFLSKDESFSNYEKLVIIAQDGVYKDVYDHLSSGAQDKIIQHLAKDLTNLPQQDVADYFVKYRQ